MRRIPTDTPLWTYVRLAINLLIFVLMEASGGTLRASTLVRFGANYAPLVANGEVNTSIGHRPTRIVKSGCAGPEHPAGKVGPMFAIR